MDQRLTMTREFLLVLALFSKNTGDPVHIRDFADLIAIHHQDWSQIDIESVARSHPDYKRVDAEIPEGSRYRTDSCSGSSYLIHETSDVYVRLEFDRFKNGPGCDTRLRAMTMEQILPRADAERRRLELLRDLRANGSVAETAEEYRWRSNDSRVKFVLTLFMDNAGNSPTSSTGDSIRLSAKLRHLAVSPDSANALPFETGYSPPLCTP